MKQPFEIHVGDCIDLLQFLVADNSVDSIVTDPPYGLSEHKPEEVAACMMSWCKGEEYRPNKKGFMGRSWDAWVPGPEAWKEAYRVLKPGGHILCFAGSRTADLMGLSLRLAGFEIRDTIMWVYGSGFPKSLDVSKAIDKAAGADREKVLVPSKQGNKATRSSSATDMQSGFTDISEPATDAARQWQGWGTALKPAHEPVIVARKPLIGTVAENVLRFGTGAVNVDGCRVHGGPSAGGSTSGSTALGQSSGWNAHENRATEIDRSMAAGRWPANLIHDGSDEVVALFPQSNGAGGSVPNVKITGYGDGIGTGKSEYFGGERTPFESGKGSAARFFYCAKASRKDRNEGIGGSDEPAVGTGATMREREDADWSRRNGNHHPTVKPTDLMRYLCRLVTPPGGTVLDPFMGSGSTGKAAVLEGFKFIGCEQDPEYAKIAEARISAAFVSDLC